MLQCCCVVGLSKVSCQFLVKASCCCDYLFKHNCVLDLGGFVNGVCCGVCLHRFFNNCGLSCSMMLCLFASAIMCAIVGMVFQGCIV